jgi:hypothetical protein
MGDQATKVARWAGLKLARRAARAVPFVGTVVAIGFVGHAIRRKGWVGGLAHSALDAIPYVGALKNGIELFTDDLIPDRPPLDADEGPVTPRRPIPR